MLYKGQLPTQRTAGAFLDALKLSGRADRCVAVFNELTDGGVDLGHVCFNIVVSALVQARISAVGGLRFSNETLAKRKCAAA